MRAIFNDKDRKYQIIAYVQNVFDEDVVEFGGFTRSSNLTATPGIGRQAYYESYDLAPPRTYGIVF